MDCKTMIFLLVLNASLLDFPVVGGLIAQEPTDQASNQMKSIAISSAKAVDAIREVYASRYRVKQGEGSVEISGSPFAGTYDFWFDFNHKRIRTDRSGDDGKTQAVWTKGGVIFHAQTSGVITTYPPDHRLPINEISKLDFRVSGFAQGAEAYLFDLTQFEELLSLTKEAIKDVSVGNGIVRISWSVPRGDSARLERVGYYFDDQFNAVRIVDKIVSNDGELQASATARFRYTTLNHTEVPLTCQYTFTPANGKTETMDWSYTWKSLNEPIPETIFTAKGLGARGGTLIVDARQAGQPIIESTVPRDGTDDLPGGPDR